MLSRENTFTATFPLWLPGEAWKQSHRKLSRDLGDLVFGISLLLSIIGSDFLKMCLHRDVGASLCTSSPKGFQSALLTAERDKSRSTAIRHSFGGEHGASSTYYKEASHGITAELYALSKSQEENYNIKPLLQRSLHDRAH